MDKKAHSDYVNAYMKENVVSKKVQFSRKSPEDMALLEWAESHGNFSGYVKDLIREEMKYITSRIEEMEASGNQGST